MVRPEKLKPNLQVKVLLGQVPRRSVANPSAEEKSFVPERGDKLQALWKQRSEMSANLQPVTLSESCSLVISYSRKVGMAEQVMTSEGNRQCMERLGETQHWTFSGYGEWDVGIVGFGTGETLLDLRCYVGEQIASINLRVKGSEVKRESDQGILPLAE